MSAPTWVQSSAGTVLTTGSTTVSLAGVTVGNVIIFQNLSDGTAGPQHPTVSDSSLENLAGTNNAITFLTGTTANEEVGNPTAAYQRLSIGRAKATTVNINIATTGDDAYIVIHEFADVSAGATLADVIENGTAGGLTHEDGTSTSVADAAVTTLGPDRLALNFVGINDDATGIAAFTGMTGGTWAMPKSFESSTGTDGTAALMTAAMAAAGTIDGGSDTITSDAWGVVGFALIGTTSDVYVPRHPAINHQDPALV